MKDVKVTLSDAYKDKTKEEKSVLLDTDIDDFSKYMATLDNEWFKGPLIAQERILIKSFLVWKIAREAT